MQSNRFRLTFLLCYLLFVFSCLEDNTTTEVTLIECPDEIVNEGSISEIEEYKIIDATLRSNFSTYTTVHVMSSSRTFILSNQYEDLQSYISDLDIEVENDLFQLYINKNENIESWKPVFTAGQLMAEAERSCFYANGEYTCDSYFSKYTDGSGFIYFSRPAVLNGTEAILEYLHETCPGLRGVFVKLHFENGNWEVVGSFTTMVS